MAGAASTPEKKASAAKAAAAPRKTTAKKRLNKGQALACEVCGLAVVVDEIGDMAVEEDTVLLCCGKPMKEKAAVKKAAKK